MLHRYVTEADLDFFKQHCEQNVQLEGASKWEQQMDKDFDTFSYSAWRRILPVRTDSVHLAQC